MSVTSMSDGTYTMDNDGKEKEYAQHSNGVSSPFPILACREKRKEFEEKRRRISFFYPTAATHTG